MDKEKQPLRYCRNFNSLTAEDQQKLYSSKVAVIGCGGLGGYIAEQLARLGVGRLILVDGDKIEESNLNRQLFALEENIALLKVEAAKNRLQKVNSSVRVDVFPCWFDLQTGKELIQEADLVCDALDNGKTRIELEQACHELNLPLVVSAIGGWYGLIGVSCPGDYLARNYFGEGKNGIEKELGNPAFTPGS
jgi:molybdopterin/thiamine biosynthesis adenylyltransferase